MTKILFFAGSARKDSINKKLAQLAAEKAKSRGVTATFVDLADYVMPLYDGDLEAAESLPENAIKLKELFQNHDGFFIASPEYNSSFSPMLKNTLDWISRPHVENEPSLFAFKGKVAALSATSPGMLGGLRGLVPLRMMLGNIGVFVTPTQAAIGQGFDAFDNAGALKQDAQDGMLNATIDEMISAVQKIHA